MSACPVSASVHAHGARLAREWDEEVAFEEWQESQPQSARLEDFEDFIDATRQRDAFDVWQMARWRAERRAA